MEKTKYGTMFDIDFLVSSNQNQFITISTCLVYVLI